MPSAEVGAPEGVGVDDTGNVYGGWVAKMAVRRLVSIGNTARSAGAIRIGDPHRSYLHLANTWSPTRNQLERRITIHNQCDLRRYQGDLGADR